ncbi:type I polyketide synthase [Ensifer aridi]|uniref:type I polyketide synthase n=1 Tax=Ensifer aridi TaxID=1708715 RepID=UPI000550D4E5|nr:type I polyketide synthase [Ensifer aridi]
MTNATETGHMPLAARCRTVSQEFIECAHKFPHMIAVQCGDERLTYRELLGHASHVAQQLIMHGVCVGDIILMNPARHLDSAIIIIGVMLSGATVCPLDMGASETRIRNILAASRAKFIVLTDKTPVAAKASQLLQSFCIDTILVERRLSDEVSNVENLSTPERGCYLLFTSGTTGTPKGVLMPHRGLANLIQWDIRFRGCEPGTTHLQFASFNFDVAFHELFSAISSGGTAVLATQDQRQDAGLLLELLSSCRIKKAYLPYSVLNQLALAAQAFAEPLYLTDVTTAGEPLKITEQIRSLFNRLGATLYNNYGSTEVQDVTSLRLAGDPERWPDLPSIGAPIAGMEVGVLTSKGVTSEPGSEGPIVVKGCQVAIGYIQSGVDDPLPLPSASTGSADEYLTGDLGIILPDGNIAIAGRADREVKIRGKRVDVAAVESVMERSRYVNQAAVVATEISGRSELIAFVISAEDSKSDVLKEDIRTLITDALDGTAVPCQTYTLSAFPETTTGKIDRRALQSMAASAVRAPARDSGQRNNVQRRGSDIWNEVLPGGDGRSFRAAGGDSLSAMQLVTRLKQELKVEVYVSDISDETTLESLLRTAKLRGDLDENEATFTTSLTRNAVAIIGMAGRFPGADSVDALWEGLINNQIFFSESKNDPPALSMCENFVRTGGFLEHHDHFDAEFFGISDREAALMDPQQRIFLECSWHALENAGYAPTAVPYRTGVYSASGASTYLINNILPSVIDECGGPFLSHRLIRNVGEILIEQGNSPEHVSMRVSNKLNLTGPSLSVGSACSGGLVAVHHAVQAIRLGEADMAIAGGVSVSTPQHVGYFAHEGVILSPTGCCRPFDAAADGSVFGNGCAVLVLKDYDLAVRDGDQITAVIVGSAVNNDGARKLSYTGPSVEGQIDVINAALADAGLTASDIDYVEAHGTGTPVGDSIEITALAATYGAAAIAQNCLVGSLKANIGHLDEAAGAAGLLKTALCLQRGRIPAIPTFRSPHERMPLRGTRLRIACGEAQDWNYRFERPRRAAISSFGIGGTNCHMILEGGDARVGRAQIARDPQQNELFVLSAGSSEQLMTLCREVHELLAASGTDLRLRDVCMTSCVGRRPERFRVGWTVSSKTELSQLLNDVVVGASSPSDSLAPKKIAGLFTGQGCQWTGMGKELSAAFPAFRESMEDCFECVRRSHGIELKQVIEEIPDRDPRLNRTEFTQPAIFAFEYAMTQLLRSFGVQFEEIAGHSFGEIAGLVAAGALPLEDACFLVSERGRLSAELPTGMGAMAVATGNAEDVALLVSELGDGVTVAAFNSPNAVVLSGRADLVAKLADTGEVSGCTVTQLPISHAFHSEQMRPIVDKYRSVIAKLRFCDPIIPVVSSVTGAPLQENQDWVKYLTDQVVGPVRFHDVLHYMLDDRSKLFVEVGPKPMLLGLGMDLDPEEGRPWIASCRSSDELGTFLRALAELFKLGINLDFNHLAHRGAWRRVSLPTYPFHKTQYLCAPPLAATKRASDGTSPLGDVPKVIARSRDNALSQQSLECGRAEPSNKLADSSKPLNIKPTIGPDPEKSEAIRRIVAPSGEYQAYQSEENVLWDVLERIAALLGKRSVSTVDPDLKWNDLGLDSLLLIELRNNLRKCYGNSISMTMFMKCQTPRSLANGIYEVAGFAQSGTEARASKHARLLLIPGITGEPMDFVELIPLLGGISTEVLEYPQGIDPWRSAPTPMDVISSITSQAKKAAGENNVVLLGYSFGGKVANEVGLALLRLGTDVSRVIIIDVPPGAFLPVAPKGSIARPLGRMEFGMMLKKDPAKAFNVLDLACHSNKLEADFRRTASIYWTNALIASQFEASKTSIPLTFIRARVAGALDNLLADESLSAADPTWGWKTVASTVDVHIVDGDHFSIMEHDKVSQIADLVKRQFPVSS